MGINPWIYLAKFGDNQNYESRKILSTLSCMVVGNCENFWRLKIYIKKKLANFFPKINR
jgi:hypothetical protein